MSAPIIFQFIPKELIYLGCKPFATIANPLPMITIRYNYTSGIVGCVNRPMRQQNHNSCNKHGVIRWVRRVCCENWSDTVTILSYSQPGQKTLYPLDNLKLLDKTNTLPFYIWPQETIKIQLEPINYPFDWRSKCDIWKSFPKYACDSYYKNILKLTLSPAQMILWACHESISWGKCPKIAYPRWCI